MFKKISSATLILSLAISLFMQLYRAPHAAAVTGGEWRAGNIIDGSVFTFKDSMSIADIQSFLNQKVGTGSNGTAGQCDTNGTKTSELGGGTRAEYGTAHNNPKPFTCLKDYYEVPKTSPGPGVPASNYGGAAIPAGAESAANLIYDAAQRYNISPRVLLVTIQKESAGPLITDDWPFKTQYTYAMGAHCPDSGPNGTANCDSNYSGFSIQISESAALLRYYLDNMTQPWWPYKKVGVNAIQYSPATACGSTSVNVENSATAALYTYTPYQPNQAALNNLYGLGDSCSAYGNRNFWRIFSDWFGSTQTNIEYGWNFVSNTIYSDAGLTQQINPNNSIVTVAPGGKAYVVIKARNNGNRTWDQSVVHLGTSLPHDHASVFADSSWINPARIKMTETTVVPGDTGTFTFSVTAPTTTGGYLEHLNLVADGVAWMNDPNFGLRINVVSPITVSPSSVNVSDLSSGQTVFSAANHYALVMQTDGNLVLYNNGVAAWYSATNGHPGARFVKQGDCNLVIYSAQNIPLWSSGTANAGTSCVLTLQPDGNLVLNSGANVTLWSTNTSNISTELNSVMEQFPSGGILLPSQQLETPDRQHTLRFQGDGNLVLYNAQSKPLWSAGTASKPVAYLVNQGDGNLVIYSTSGKPLWSSGTANRGRSTLILQGDGNLVLYANTQNNAVWASNTSGQ
jgi:hypothetical protein